jgi:hypothetical protein
MTGFIIGFWQTTHALTFSARMGFIKQESVLLRNRKVVL